MKSLVNAMLYPSLLAAIALLSLVQPSFGGGPKVTVGRHVAVAGQPNAVLAFWIDAYNAVTVRGILREYPTSSIRNHTAKLFGYDIWKDLLLLVR